MRRGWEDVQVVSDVDVLMRAEDSGDRNSRQPPRQEIVSKSLEPTFFIFHKHGGILHSWISFAITALIERFVLSTDKIAILLYSVVFRFSRNSERPFRGGKTYASHSPPPSPSREGTLE